MALTKVTSHLMSDDQVSVMDFIPSSERQGIIDNTSTYDCTNAFRSASATGRPVYIPAGQYFISNTVNPNSGDSKLFHGALSGGGYRGQKSIIRVNDSALSNSDKIFNNLTFCRSIQLRATNKNCIGFSFSNNGLSAFNSHDAKDLWVEGCYRGFEIGTIYSSRFERLVAIYNYDGFYFKPTFTSGNTGYATNTTFDSCSAGSNDNYGWYVHPDGKSPTLSFVNCTVEGASSTAPYIGSFNANIEPCYIRNMYLEGAGGTSGHLYLNGSVDVEGLYDNSTQGVTAGASTARLKFSNVKQTSQTVGFTGGSSNFTSFSMQNSPRMEGFFDNYPTGWFSGVIDPDGGLDRNYLRVAKSTTFAVDGTTSGVLDIDFGSSYKYASVLCHFILKATSGGLDRQVASGMLTINYLNYGDDVTDSSIAVSGLSKALQGSTTLTDPSFTLSGSGSVLTVSCAATSSLTDGQIHIEPIVVHTRPNFDGTISLA